MRGGLHQRGHDRPRDPASALEKLRDAEAHAAQGDYVGALALLSEAFDGLLDDYSDRKRSSSGSSPYKWWPPDWPFSFPSIPSFYGRDHDAQMVQRTENLAKQTEQINHALREMQRAMRVLSVSLDYRRYARFQLLVPHRNAGNGRSGLLIRGSALAVLRGPPFSPWDCARCALRSGVPRRTAKPRTYPRITGAVPATCPIGR